MLPAPNTSRRPTSRHVRNIRQFFHTFQWRNLDMELALFQLRLLCWNPAGVYKLAQMHKQTKNRWSRDDPTFALLVCAAATVSAIIWGIVFAQTNPLVYFAMCIAFATKFMVAAIVIASITWHVTNKFLMGQVAAHKYVAVRFVTATGITRLQRTPRCRVALLL